MKRALKRAIKARKVQFYYLAMPITLIEFCFLKTLSQNERVSSFFSQSLVCLLPAASRLGALKAFERQEVENTAPGL